MAAIQRAENRSSHNHRLDRFHIARVHCHFGLAGLKRKTQPRAVVGDRAGNGRRVGGREQRQFFHSCRRQVWHIRRFSYSYQRDQLGGVLHPFAARITESSVHDDDILGDDHWLADHLGGVLWEQELY